MVLEFRREVCAKMGVIRVQGAGEDMSVQEIAGDRTQLRKSRRPWRRIRQSREEPKEVGEKPERDILLAAGGTMFHKRRDGPTDPTAPRGSWRQGPPNVP